MTLPFVFFFLPFLWLRTYQNHICICICIRILEIQFHFHHSLSHFHLVFLHLFYLWYDHHHYLFAFIWIFVTGCIWTSCHLLWWASLQMSKILGEYDAALPKMYYTHLAIFLVLVSICQHDQSKTPFHAAKFVAHHRILQTRPKWC